jgi:hypothetical protein
MGQRDDDDVSITASVKARSLEVREVRRPWTRAWATGGQAGQESTRKGLPPRVEPGGHYGPFEVHLRVGGKASLPPSVRPGRRKRRHRRR